MRAVFSIVIALIFLATNIHLSLGTHFCGGHAVKTELLFADRDLGCGMTKEDMSCEKANSSAFPGFKQKECCEDQFLGIQIQDDFSQKIPSTLNPDFTLISMENGIALYKFVYAGIGFAKPPKPPPVISQDRQVIFQTFLI